MMGNVTHGSETESSSLLLPFPHVTPTRFPLRPWRAMDMLVPFHRYVLDVFAQTLQDLRSVWDEYAAFADFSIIENVEGKQCRVVHMHQGGRDWTIQSSRCVCSTQDQKDTTPTYVHKSKDGDMVCQACYEYVSDQRFLG